MIRKCDPADFNQILSIINDAAIAYKGVIPEACMGEPYMPATHLEKQIADGVVFYAYQLEGDIIGVMGIQDKHDITLIRHAYVRTLNRNGGIGGQLLQFLIQQTSKPVLIGTWRKAEWAVGFYQKHGFKLIDGEEKTKLLCQYWNISPLQEQNSVVLANSFV